MFCLFCCQNGNFLYLAILIFKKNCYFTYFSNQTNILDCEQIIVYI